MLTSEQVIQNIKGLPHMADLPVDKYAEEDGWADSFVQNLRSELKATQLRRFFHQVKQLKLQAERSGEFQRSNLAQVMPTLAYAVGRKLIPQAFYDLMILCFGQQRCNTKEDFLAAANFLEAIMAYHKYRS